MTAYRVRYREGQLLRADDLADEQAYRLGARQRHTLTMHGWGIVRGLELEATLDGLLLHPGLAIDGYGRELIVPAPVSMSWGDLSSGPKALPAALDIWLIYAKAPLTPIRDKTCDGGRHDRWREQARLRLYPAQATPVDPRKPPGVALTADPRLVATLPDDANPWPIYLGRVVFTLDKTVQGRVMPATRPYATLVGEMVKAPLRDPEPPPASDIAAPATGGAQPAASAAADQGPPPVPRARMQVGAERLGDSRRFAVEMPDERGVWAERMALSRSGDLTLPGQTTIRRARAQLDDLVGELFRPGSAWPFKPHHLYNLQHLTDRLAHPETPLWHYLRGQLSNTSRVNLDAYARGALRPNQLCNKLLKDLNQALIYPVLVHNLFIAGRTPPVKSEDLKDPPHLIEELLSKKDVFYQWLHAKLSPGTRIMLAAYTQGDPIPQELLDAVIADLNNKLGNFDAALPGGLHIGRPSPEFTCVDLIRPAALLCRLQLGTSKLAVALRAKLANTMAQQLAAYRPSDEPPATLLNEVVQALNSMLDNDLDLARDYGQSLSLNDATRRVLATLPRIWANRLILQLAFPQELLQLDEWGVSFRPLPAPPATAAPWRLYRTERTVDNVAFHELCAEIGGAGKQGDPARYRLAVGAYEGAGFKPCLSVTSGGRVTVAGTLRVEGQVRESPIDVNPKDPRFGETLIERIAEGLALGFDTSSLQLQIARVDATSYTISIENHSNQPLTNLIVYESLYVAGQPKRLNQRYELQDLAAQGKDTRTLQIPDTGKAIAIITAFGVTADFRPVYQAAEKEMP